MLSFKVLCGEPNAVKTVQNPWVTNEFEFILLLIDGYRMSVKLIERLAASTPDQLEGPWPFLTCVETSARASWEHQNDAPPQGRSGTSEY